MKTSLLIKSIVAAAAVSASFSSIKPAMAIGAQCSTSDVTFGGIAATACAGSFSGNDIGNKGTLLPDLNNGLFDVGEGVTWKLAEAPNALGFFADNGETDGGWGFGTEALTSGLKTFVISLKASTSYSTYLFENVDLSVTGLTGIFNTIGTSVNRRGKAQELSHASLFVATVPPSEEKPNKIPEPATTAALGFVVIGGLKLKRKIANA